MAVFESTIAHFPTLQSERRCTLCFFGGGIAVYSGLCFGHRSFLFPIPGGGPDFYYPLILLLFLRWAV